MNFCGKFIDLNKEDDILEFDYSTKLWYILYSKPMNNKEYYAAISMANIYINEKFQGMSYNLSYRNSIIDHIEINKH
jgi:hypothetical protein